MKAILASIFTVMFTANGAWAQDMTLRNGGPSSSEMTALSSQGAPDGTAFFRPALSGVLYRTGLSKPQRSELCKAGFSKAFYAGFG